MGLRYDPPLLALEFNAPADDLVMRKDIPLPDAGELAGLVADVADDACSQAILDALLEKHARGCVWFFCFLGGFFSRRRADVST